MYDPVIIATDDYGDIRLALGFEASDDANVSPDLIEGRLFLRDAETDVKRLIPTYATIVDEGDADYDEGRADTLKAAVIHATASRLAVEYFAKRTGSEVTSEGVGPLKVTFREGPEWVELGCDEAKASAALIYRALYWGQTSAAVGVASLAGPSRTASTRPVRIGDIERSLWPPVVYGSGGPV